jgi:hypothetical protein
MEDQPSPAGCCYDDKKLQLVQSEHGLQYHLQKLPSQLGDAFHRHGECGQAAIDMGDWETARREFECCRNVVKELIATDVGKATQDWLLVWASLPLADLYHFHEKRLKEACEIQKEMLNCVMPLQDSDEHYMVFHTLAIFYYISLYEWGYSASCSSNPAVRKDSAVEKYAMLQDFDEKEAEPHICYLLAIEHFRHSGSLEDGLHWLKEAKRVWGENFPDKKNYDYALREASMYMLIGMYEEAEITLRGLIGSMESDQAPESGLHKLDRIETYGLLKDCYEELSRRATADGNTKRAEAYAASAVSTGIEESKLVDQVEDDTVQKVEELNRERLQHEGNQDYQKAAVCLEKCVDLIQRCDHPELKISIKLCYAQLGSLYRNLYKQSATHNSVDHEFFSRAVHYYEEYLKLMVSPLDVADANYELARLYGILDQVQICPFDTYAESLEGPSLAEHFHELQLSASNHSLEVDSYLAKDTPLLDYGKKAALIYADILYTMTENSECWTRVLEFHKNVYTLLQEYNVRRYVILERNRILTCKPLDHEHMETANRWMRQALLWAERERTRALLYQLGPNKLSPLTSKELWDFDIDDHVAWEALQCTPAVCGDGTVFVEYSNFTRMNRWFVYVLTQVCPLL